MEGDFLKQIMLIAYTSDFHIDTSKENFQILEFVKQKLKKKPADVLIIAGDIGSYLRSIIETLSYLREIPAKKIFVPGNHDIWKEDGYSSNNKYFELLVEICENNDFIPLWKTPVIINGIGFVGCMGWYDYTFGNPEMHFTAKDYLRKELNGSIWMDKYNVSFFKDYVKIDDIQIVQMVYEKFILDCETIYPEVEKIIAVFHHPPFKEMLTYKGIEEWDYFTAFMGAEIFGDYIKNKDKIEIVISGHQHKKKQVEIETSILGKKITSISSPFGYYQQEAENYTIEEWYEDRLSYLELT